MIEERKNEEAEFHNKLRDERLKGDSQEYRHLTSNLKFYFVARRSQKFVGDFLIKNCPGKMALDYCCGEGNIAIFLAEKGAEAFGVDISPVSIQNAQKEAEKKGLKNVSFFVIDAEKLKFDDSFFDLIVCSGVLHHLNIERAYQELSRVLKPDGKIICAEPLVYNPIFQLYRKLTPHLRTKWEAEHILGKKDINLAKKYFNKIEIRFFHLFVLFTIPFLNLPFIFNSLLSVLEYIDSILLKLPLIKWLAWQIVFIISGPKK